MTTDGSDSDPPPRSRSAPESTTQSRSGNRVLRAVAERRDRINAVIDEYLPLKDPERLYEASRYLLEAGGKRLRPTVVLLTAEALADIEPLSTTYQAFPDRDGHSVDMMAAAMSIEVIQTFTLIHDDIMDQDDLRRGVPAVHEAYDTETAILAGDTLYSKAYEIMLKTDAPDERMIRALELITQTCTEICEGQSLDVSFETRTDVLPDEYLDMVERKTAVLYAASAAVPAIIYGADETTVDALYGYGLDIGRAFQIQDDVLDLVVPSDKLGKRRGSDLVENKRTLITLHAREQGVDVDSLIEADRPDRVTEAEVETAVATLEDAGSIDYARNMARQLVTDGKARLESLPENEPRELLVALADYLIERSY